MDEEKNGRKDEEKKGSNPAVIENKTEQIKIIPESIQKGLKINPRGPPKLTE